MKNKFLAVLLVGVLALGALCAVQWRQLQAARQQVAESRDFAQAETEARAVQGEKIKQLEAQRARLGQDVDQFTRLVNDFRARESSYASNAVSLSQANPAASGTDTGNGVADAAGLSGGKGLGDMLSKMMKDPAMKEMMRGQQKMMVQKMYGPLVKDLNLPPEQKDRFMELLLDHQLSAIDQAGALFQSGEADKSEATQALKDKQAELEANLKALVGDEKYAEYKDSSKTMGERMQLDQFRQQLDGSPLALQDEQSKSLLQVMKEERERVPPVVPSNGSDNLMATSKLLNDETLAKQFAWQEDLDKRVQERAGQVLTPEQMKEFADFQSQQLNMQKVGMKMAREMFGAGQTPAPTHVEVIATPAK